MFLQIDITSRLSAAFGAKLGLAFAVANTAATAYSVLKTKGDWAKSGSITEDPSEGLFDVVFKNGAQSFNLEFTAQNKTFDGIYFHPPVPTFSRSKAVSVTNIDNSAMQVIENFGMKPWAITLSGVAVDMSGQMRVGEMMASINKMFDIQDIIDVEGAMYNDLGIYSAYTTEFERLAILEGYPDTIVYVIRLNSCEADQSAQS